MEFKGSNIFLNIPIYIARDPVLLDKTPKGILLMGEIVSMLNVTGKFFMSNAEMAKRLRVSQGTVKNYLDLLEERGYIVRKIIYKENSKQIVGREITLGQSAVLGWGNALTEGRSIAKPRVGQPTDHKKNSLREQSKRTFNNLSQEEKERDKNTIEILINYLNHCAEEWRRPIITFSDSEINKMIKAVHGKDTRKLKEAAEKTIVYGEQYPQGYLLTCIKNLPEEVVNEE